MSRTPINHILFKQCQTAVGTDCTFVFKDKSDGKSFKQIHAHRCVLSGVSPYFATNLKSIWKGNKPIEIVTVEYSVFQGILRSIYLNQMDPLEDLQFGLDLYAAGHFYQMDDVVDLVRDGMMQFCEDKKPLAISELFKLSSKYQDYFLAEFLRAYFVTKANALILLEDFKNYPIDAVNMLYQIDGLNVPEEKRFKVLEAYVERNGEACIPLLRPAIKRIHFGEISSTHVQKTVLITEEQKNVQNAKVKVRSSISDAATIINQNLSSPSDQPYIVTCTTENGRKVITRQLRK